MDESYNVTVFDNFHPYDPDEAWIIGTFATPDAAIEAVKRRIDHELSYLWLEICQRDKGLATVDRLVAQYESFADNPIAFGPGNCSIFDSTAYMTARAAEMVEEERGTSVEQAEPVPQAQSSTPALPTSDIASRERQIPLLPERQAALNGWWLIVVPVAGLVLAVGWVIFHRS